jgi:putative ABC transport system permease protein
MPASERWFRLLLRLYPADFRDEMGGALVEAYLDRCRTAVARGGTSGLVAVCLRALVDSVRNGVGERLRPAVRWRRAGNWGRDTELAVRRLRRAPAFSLAMIGTLMVGLGAFAVVLTVIDKTLIEPLPYERPSDLYFVWRDYSAFFDLKRGWLGGPDVADLAKAGGPIAGAVGIRTARRTLSDARAGEGNPEEVNVMMSSANLFDLLGVHPIIGRGFAPTEVGPNRSPVIVLGYDLWQRRFAGERGVIGTPVRVNGEQYTVIGVMGRAFQFVRHTSLGAPEHADAYITFATNLATMNPGGGSFSGLIRARPGTSPAQVTAAVAAVGKALDERAFKNRGLKLYPVGLHADLVANVRPALVVLGLSGAFLVLVLAANLATLLLARAVHREREFAVSRALGANPMALVRATLLEAGLLGAIGGMCASVLAVWGTRVLVALAPLDLPRRESIAVDWQVVMTVVGVGALLGLVAGAAPAFWASRSTLSTLLRNAAVRGGGHGRLRRSLVVIQVALCLVLLCTGGLVARSFEGLLRSHPGFDPHGVLTFRVPIAQWRYPDNASAVAFDARLERELAALPGVISVSAASAVPLTANTDQSDIVLPGAPGNTGNAEHDAPLVDTPQSRSGWFRTLGIPILAGRDFGPRRPGERREAIIDRTLAAQFFPSGGAVGNTAVFGKDTLMIVGVVEHARQYDLHRDGRPQAYLRDEDDSYGALYFAVRTRRDPHDLVADARATVRRLDPELAISQVRTLDDVVNDSIRQQRVSAVLVAGFSIGALLLAAMGLFGVVAGSVARRRHEIAVRLALGADRGRVLRLVLGEGAALVALGILVAIPGIYVTGRTMRGVLVGISPFDPLTLGAVAVGLMLVALAACYVPARRVGFIDPARALRED